MIFLARFINVDTRGVEIPVEAALTPNKVPAKVLNPGPE
jgi:hypothetical protein